MSYIVPTKPLDDVIFDLDDFYLDYNAMALSELYYLKHKYPKFKATLFAVPNFNGQVYFDFLESVADLDWIQLALHGVEHTPNECGDWDKIESEYVLSAFEELEFFENIFKAPSWVYSKDLYEVLRERDWICADHPMNKDMWLPDLKVYSLSNPWCVHGHTWNLNNPNPEYNNGIRQIIERGVPWTQDTNFHFMGEIYDK